MRRLRGESPLQRGGRRARGGVGGGGVLLLRAEICLRKLTVHMHVVICKLIHLFAAACF